MGLQNRTRRRPDGRPLNPAKSFCMANGYDNRGLPDSHASVAPVARQQGCSRSMGARLLAHRRYYCRRTPRTPCGPWWTSAALSFGRTSRPGWHASLSPLDTRGFGLGFGTNRKNQRHAASLALAINIGMNARPQDRKKTRQNCSQLSPQREL